MIIKLNSLQLVNDKRDAETDRAYLLLVDRYASSFDRPELRLRFLNRTVAEQTKRRERWHRRVKRIAFVERSRLYRWLLEIQLFRTITEEFRNLLPDAPFERRRVLRQAPWNVRVFLSLYQIRYLIYCAGVGVVGVSFFGLFLLARQAVDFVSRAAPFATAAKSQTTSLTGSALTAASVAYLPDYRPEKVWLVESTATYERYSNGARILTEYETDNHQRAYYRYTRTGIDDRDSVPGHEPVGIVYHSSESDIVPFNSDNSESIQALTEGLRSYIRRHRSYNYLIDRFGEICRIVKDDQAANHAGHSIWADSDRLYIGLNESFIGICFESTSSSGALNEQLTEAQLVSGRALTAILRSKYQISDANCTTHGLVSVNPERQTIAHHHDWVRGFPFAAFSLSDKYAISPPSVGVYGFGTDEEIMAKLGGVTWPGAMLGETEFRNRPGTRDLGVDEMKRRQVVLYRTQMEKEWALRRQAPTESAARR